MEPTRHHRHLRALLTHDMMNQIRFRKMKRIIYLLLVLNIVYVGHAVSAEKEPNLKLSLTLVETTKDKRVIRVFLENLDTKPVRVLLPEFYFYRFGFTTQAGGYSLRYGHATGVGGYSLLFIGPDGKPADIKWAMPPGAIPAFPTLKDTVLLQPGMGVSLRVPLTGKLIDPQKVSSIVAHYVVYGPTRESIKKTGGGSILLKLGKPSLWQGGRFVSEPLLLLKN